jgi:hypothetical protein
LCLFTLVFLVLPFLKKFGVIMLGTSGQVVVGLLTDGNTTKQARKNALTDDAARVTPLWKPKE